MLFKLYSIQVSVLVSMISSAPSAVCQPSKVSAIDCSTNSELQPIAWRGLDLFSEGELHTSRSEFLLADAQALVLRAGLLRLHEDSSKLSSEELVLRASSLLDRVRKVNYQMPWLSVYILARTGMGLEWIDASQGPSPQLIKFSLIITALVLYEDEKSFVQWMREHPIGGSGALIRGAIDEETGVITLSWVAGEQDDAAVSAGKLPTYASKDRVSLKAMVLSDFEKLEYSKKELLDYLSQVRSALLEARPGSYEQIEPLEPTE